MSSWSNSSDKIYALIFLSFRLLTLTFHIQLYFSMELLVSRWLSFNARLRQTHIICGIGVDESSLWCRWRWAFFVISSYRSNNGQRETVEPIVATATEVMISAPNWSEMIPNIPCGNLSQMTNMQLVCQTDNERRMHILRNLCAIN